MSKTVGMIGLGIMGGAIAPNLIERDWTVIGYDVDSKRGSELAAKGVTLAANIAEVVERRSW